MNKGKLTVLGNVYDILFLNFPELDVITKQHETTAKWKPFRFACVESENDVFSCGGCVLETEKGTFLLKNSTIAENVIYFGNCFKDE